MRLKKNELALCISMHDSGISYSIIASYFKVTTDTLRKQIKNYEQCKIIDIPKGLIKPKKI